MGTCNKIGTDPEPVIPDPKPKQNFLNIYWV